MQEDSCSIRTGLNGKRPKRPKREAITAEHLS